MCTVGEIIIAENSQKFILFRYISLPPQSDKKNFYMILAAPNRKTDDHIDTLQRRKSFAFHNFFSNKSDKILLQ